MKIVFATGNKGKLREAQEILGPAFEVLSPAEAGVVGEAEETGSTLKENSLLKAEYVASRCSLPVFADDTGLEVDILGGAPGIYTARYAGEGRSFEDNIDKLLGEIARMQGEASFAASMGLRMKPLGRRARFHCIVTLIRDGRTDFFEGVVEGRIALRRAGPGGFGYDPVFIADAFPGRTLAEVPEDDKNAVSHRGKSLRALAEFLA